MRQILMLVSLCVIGCHAETTVRQNVDALVCDRANHPHDPEPTGLVCPGSPAVPAQSAAPAASIDFQNMSWMSDSSRNAQLASFQEPGELPQPKTTLEKRLLEKTTQQSGLPGGEAPAIVVPPIDKKKPKEVEKILGDIAKKYFPPLPALGPEPGPVPDRQPLTLADLQHLALTNSPLIRQAASDIEAARGAAVQAGAYPNPTLGFTSQTPGPGGGPNYGFLASQTIKTAGKLKLAQAAAVMDLENARLAYRRAETDLAAAVRSGYFAVLVAQENIKANQALLALTDEVYKVMVDQMKSGEFATYEPMQVAVFSAQARAALIQARNSYTLAWRQLAASLGLPALPPTEVVGRIDMPAPVYVYDKLLAHVLSRHTDVLSALNGIEKARFNLEAAKVTPIPDVNVNATVYEDLTPGAPNRLVAIGGASVTLPVWDLNRGAVHQARSALLRANEEPHRVRDDLSGRLADAYRRYTENRDLLALYRAEILPKQVQAFRAAVQRHYAAEASGVAYTDLISAEQNLVAVVAPYLATLSAFWQAVVDTANLLQTDDLFQVADGEACLAAVPDLEQLLALPCCHPCSPAHDRSGASGGVPRAAIGPPGDNLELLPQPAGK
jgi:cobalt-zinc-cadmium efflux system outer membrane protein